MPTEGAGERVRDGRMIWRAHYRTPDGKHRNKSFTGASLAIASGADVTVVQQMLGHTPAAMTLDQYGHRSVTGSTRSPA